MPVYQPNILLLQPRTFFLLGAIAQHLVNRFVGVIEVFALTNRRRNGQLTYGALNQRTADPTRLQPTGKHVYLNVAVVVPVLPIAQIAPAQLLLEKLNHPALGCPLALTHIAHNGVLLLLFFWFV